MKNVISMGLMVISSLVLLTSCGGKEETKTTTENVATDTVTTENATSNVSDSLVVE